MAWYGMIWYGTHRNGCAGQHSDLVAVRGIVPDMGRVVRLGFFSSELGVVAALAGVLAQLVELGVHFENVFAQRGHCEFLGVGEARVLALFFCLVGALVELVELGPLCVAVVLLFHVVVELLAAAEADAVAVAVARVHGRAVDLVAGEDVVPDVLEDAAGELVVHARGEQPLAVVDEALERDLADAVARDGELCAADAGEGWRDGGARVDLLPDALAPVDLLGLVEEVKVAAGAVHVDPVGAAGVVVAAHVHVAEAGDALVVEAVDNLGGVEAHELVVVPGVAVGVHEEGRVGQVIVVVDDVAEVDLGQQSASCCARGGGQPAAPTMASRPLFLGTRCSAWSLSTS